MKHIVTLIAVSTALTASLLAGPKTIESKMVVPAIENYGIGWYGAIDGGVNVYQNYGSDQHANVFGHDLSLEVGDRVGGFGGLKLGYVFGTGLVRPALEADCYYNGFRPSITAKIDGHTIGNADVTINSGAFLGNSLLRFNFERFQPYLGFGLGGWVAKGDNIDINVDGRRVGHADTGTDSGLAWQIVAGTDYYFTPKVSTFLEYKFLNYVNAVFDNTVSQQLIAAGIRFHF